MPLELLETFPVGLLGCNCSIVADPAAGEAIVVDPGDDLERILSFLAGARLRAVALVHTHAHFDHVGASAELARATGAPILLHAGDSPLYAALPEQGRAFGLPVGEPGPVSRLLAEGDLVACGSGALEVLHTPGHTPGSLCFRMGGDRPVLFSGDTLFRRSVGRTDLWGGSTEDLLASIREKLLVLPGDLPVVPGHGDGTTIAEEARLNPFFGSRSHRFV
jgi:glyoxylase-like metal-dependent hydrolase (beta-lactamase superfamily II)